MIRDIIDGRLWYNTGEAEAISHSINTTYIDGAINMWTELTKLALYSVFNMTMPSLSGPIEDNLQRQLSAIDSYRRRPVEMRTLFSNPSMVSATYLLNSVYMMMCAGSEQ